MSTVEESSFIQYYSTQPFNQLIGIPIHCQVSDDKEDLMICIWLKCYFFFSCPIVQYMSSSLNKVSYIVYSVAIMKYNCIFLFPFISIVSI